MTDWHANTSRAEGTWGALIGYLLSFDGVDIGVLPDVALPGGATGAVEYLFRLHNGVMLDAPMPRNCWPERPVGLMKVVEVCRRLLIPVPPEWHSRF